QFDKRLEYKDNNKSSCYIIELEVNMPVSNKHGRVNEDIKRELIAIIGEMKDPRVQGFLTVMRVEVTPDLSSAKVYVSMMGTKDNATKEAVDALKHAAGHIRTEISKRMHIHKAPELIFYADDGAKYAAHINELLEGLKKE
ncbi:MAG: 30S ribosome-binding factor RbfA, partial [Oscillospiraceae bacterium]